MRVLVTGAGGFLGRYVVAEAIRAGHEVVAAVRPSGQVPDASWLCHPRLRIVRADLRNRSGLAEMLAGVDAVLHVAAAKTGDVYAQFAGTVVATENLLAAMDAAGVRSIVAISSLGVYDYRACRLFSTIDETSPIAADCFDRDGYTQAKIAQERIISEHAKANGWNYAICRPGLIFGPGQLLPARAGIPVGKRMILRLGGISRLPMVYAENCAEAIIRAADRLDRSGRIVNVIDDRCPTTRQYIRLLRRRLSLRPRVVAIPWVALQAASLLAELANRLLFHGRAKLPGLLVPARLAARVNPYRYDNRKIKAELGWSPRHSLIEALDRSIAGVPVTLPNEVSVPVTIARREAA